MKFKTAGTAFLLTSSLLLAGCNNEGNTADNSNMNQDNADAAESDTGSSTTAEEADSPDTPEEDSNASSGSQGNQAASEEDNNNGEPSQSTDTSNELPDGVQQTNYESASKAAQAIENYREVKQTNTDLGHSIQALVEGATGHQYISWNEGRWLIQMNFPTDPQYAYEPYPEGVELAKKVVEHLESHYLPAPEDRGMISINGFKDSPDTVIQWQTGKTVYTIENENGKPFEAIDKAVEFGATDRSGA
jgi:hypothetical protein